MLDRRPLDPKALYRTAQAYVALGLDSEATSFFSRALAAATDASMTADVQKELERHRRHVCGKLEMEQQVREREQFEEGIRLRRKREQEAVAEAEVEWEGQAAVKLQAAWRRRTGAEVQASSNDEANGDAKGQERAAARAANVSKRVAILKAAKGKAAAEEKTTRPDLDRSAGEHPLQTYRWLWLVAVCVAPIMISLIVALHSQGQG